MQKPNLQVRIEKIIALETVLRIVEQRGLDWPMRVTAVWVTDGQIRKLNKEHLKKDRVTDVLSFGAPPVFIDQGHLGELLVAYGQTVRQAKEQGHPLRREVDVLLVHGLLHLLGMDHAKNQKGARQMQQAEAQVLTELWAQGSPRSARTAPKGLIERSMSVPRKKLG